MWSAYSSAFRFRSLKKADRGFSSLGKGMTGVGSFSSGSGGSSSGSQGSSSGSGGSEGGAAPGKATIRPPAGEAGRGLEAGLGTLDKSIVLNRASGSAFSLRVGAGRPYSAMMSSREKSPPSASPISDLMSISSPLFSFLS